MGGAFDSGDREVPELLCEEADVVIRDIKEIIGVIEERVVKS